MSLRKSPARTPAFLAANRANAAKSTGPRTARGRERTLLNGLGAGRRSQFLDTLARAPLSQQLDFARLYASIYKCLSPPAEGPDLVLPFAARAWWTKRKMEADVRTADFKAEVLAHGGWLPKPWRMKIERGRGGLITVVVWIRTGRLGPARRRYERNRWPAGWWDGKRPLYIGVTVLHNGLRAWRPSDGPLPCSVRAHRALRESRSTARPDRIENATSPERRFTSHPVTSRNDVTSGQSNVTPTETGRITGEAGMSRLLSKLRSYLLRNSGKASQEGAEDRQSRNV